MHAWYQAATGTELQHAEQESDGIEEERHVDIEPANPNILDGNQNADQTNTLHGIFQTEATKSLLIPDQYHSMMRSLNTKQKEVMQMHFIFDKWTGCAIVRLPK